MGFTRQVAVVTGAGAGLGRSHALALARDGARVVVNDLRPDLAAAVAAEINATGGQAVAEPTDVADRVAVAAMVARVMQQWARVDALVCNAGLLRDKSFARMDMADFDRVVAVHLGGSANCCHAVWEIMRAQGYGRILLTTSTSGLFGNFGQANYGAAKAATLGLMNVLHIEGAKHGIRVNCLAPTAATTMTEGLVPDADLALLDPDTVSPALLFLTSTDAPSRVVMGAGAGAFSVVHVLETAGVWLPKAERTAEGLARRFTEIAALSGAAPLGSAFDQTAKFVALARAAGPDRAAVDQQPHSSQVTTST